jgi:hypothetical protein
MKKRKKLTRFKKKIMRRVLYYDEQWDGLSDSEKGIGVLPMCRRAVRRESFRDGAEWMLGEVVHLLRQKKYKCDKLIRDAKEDKGKSIPIFASAVYSRIIKELEL